MTGGVVVSAWHWITGVAGLFAIWIAMSLLAQFTGWFIGLQDYIYGKLNESGMPVPQQWLNITNQLNTYFEIAWNWIPVVVFISFILFIVVGSLKKRPEDEVVEM